MTSNNWDYLFVTGLSGNISSFSHDDGTRCGFRNIMCEKAKDGEQCPKHCRVSAYLNRAIPRERGVTYPKSPVDGQKLRIK
jgi:hypothetical protein